MKNERITPVILCGGGGTRLWPLSRPEYPKQLLAFTGETTMLQVTAARVSDSAMFNAPLVVTGVDQADAVEAQLASQLTARATILLEPCTRNTAPAIALAAQMIDPSTLLLVMPSDHLIGHVDAFLQAVQSAVDVALADWLVTFAVEPDRPHTGYGYIERGEPLAPGVFRATAFHEKPDAVTARALVDDGADWNSGLFLFTAGAYLRALERHDPGIADFVRMTAATASRHGERISFKRERFSAMAARSIDHAVMEHEARVAVVPLDMEWSDIGSWDALYDIGPHDGCGNSLTGNVRAIDSKGCLLRSHGPRITALGLDDLVVVATADEILIVPRSLSERVKEVAAQTLAHPSVTTDPDVDPGSAERTACRPSPIHQGISYVSAARDSQV
ncbi:MAG: mannose-1-phosphate guanylyltransferase [Tsuneonella suprasediminis]